MSEQKLLIEIQEITKIYDHFPDIDSDLLVLALTPKHTHINPTISSRLKNRYKTFVMDYNLLEYYGDIVLALIVCDETINYTSLSLSPREANDLRQTLESNASLNTIATSLGLCEIVKERQTYKKDEKSCADTVESLLGALFVQYGIDSLRDIRKWFVSMKEVRVNIQSRLQDLVASLPPAIPLLRNWVLDESKSVVDNIQDFVLAYVKAYPWFVKKVNEKEGYVLSLLDTIHSLEYIYVNARSKKEYSLNKDWYSTQAAEFFTSYNFY